MPQFVLLVNWTDQGIREAKDAVPRSERASGESLLLPLYPSLTEREQDFIIGCLHEAAARQAA